MMQWFIDPVTTQACLTLSTEGSSVQVRGVQKVVTYMSLLRTACEKAGLGEGTQAD